MVQSCGLVPDLVKKRLLIAIAIAAVVFRLAVALQPGYHQPDEIWQYIEPAWGWATGRWVQTWEFHVGLRSWLVPMLFRPVIIAAHAVNPAGQGALTALRLILALFALIIPYTFWRLASAISPLHGLVAAWVGAIWPELFYFAARTSGENLATIAIFSAILAIYGKPQPDAALRIGRERARLAWIGLSLALALIIRFQYGPAIALLALAAAGGAPTRRLPWLLLGGLMGLGLGAAADYAAGQPPLGWMLTNLRMNFTENRSGFFGSAPMGWYLQQIGQTWWLGSLLLVPGILMAARRFPLLLAVALATLLTHSLIPHKEYRFILLAQELFVFAGAVGSVDLLQAIAARWRAGGLRPTALLAVLCPIWLALAVSMAVTTPFVDYWGNGRAIAQALALAGSDPGLCGLAVYRAASHPMASYALLGRDVPILLIDGPQARLTAAENAMHFNSIFAPRLAEKDLPTGFGLVACQFPHKQPKDQYYCIFRRAGSCASGAGDLDYNTVLTRLGD